MGAENAILAFNIKEELKSVKPFGNGLINKSYVAQFKNNRRYLLQNLNIDLFENNEGLMNNIDLFTTYLKEKITKEGGDPDRETLTIIKTLDNKLFHKDKDGKVWRLYPFIEDTVCFSKAESTDQFYKTGLAFGHFQAQLNDFDATQLTEVLEKFHDTRFRYTQFEEAVENDLAKRVKDVSAEIDFIKSRKEDAYLLCDMLDKGDLPLRVTHNDTKLSNILLDKHSLEDICIVDLDTIMPGILLFDFGDSIRLGANMAEEDEKDLSKVGFNIDLFEAYTKGFLEGAKHIMTDKEIEYLAWGARVITFEQAIRFFTDYLNGDTYYTVSHNTHNLERTRNQMKLVSDMEEMWPEILEIVQKATR